MQSLKSNNYIVIFFLSNIILINSFFFNSFFIEEVGKIFKYWNDNIYVNLDDHFLFISILKDIPSFHVLTDLKCIPNYEIEEICLWPGNYQLQLVVASLFFDREVSNLYNFLNYFTISITILYIIFFIYFGYFILKKFGITPYVFYNILIVFSPYLIAWSNRHHEIFLIHMILSTFTIFLNKEFIRKKFYLYLSIIFIVSFLALLTKYDYYFFSATGLLISYNYQFFKFFNKDFFKKNILIITIMIISIISAFSYHSFIINYMSTFGLFSPEIIDRSFINWLIDSRINERTFVNEFKISDYINLFLRNITTPIVSIFQVNLFNYINIFSITLLLHFLIDKNQKFKKSFYSVLLSFIFLFIGQFFNYIGINHPHENIIIFMPSFFFICLYVGSIIKEYVKLQDYFYKIIILLYLLLAIFSFLRPVF